MGAIVRCIGRDPSVVPVPLQDRQHAPNGISVHVKDGRLEKIAQCNMRWTVIHIVGQPHVLQSCFACKTERMRIQRFHM